MKEVLVLISIGLGVGIPAAMALGRLVATQLYGIQPHDPSIAVATGLLLATVSAAAGLIPAHRAGRIDPLLGGRARLPGRLGGRLLLRRERDRPQEDHRGEAQSDRTASKRQRHD